MLSTLKLILSWIAAVVLIGTVLGALAFFAAAGIGIMAILLGLTVIGLTAIAIQESVSNWFRRRRYRQRSQRP